MQIKSHHTPLKLQQICRGLGLLVLALGLAACTFGEAAAPPAPPTPTLRQMPPRSPVFDNLELPGEDGRPWVEIPELPPGAAQADYGAEIYDLVCVTCHGDRGQGLTPDWIATWDPQDQNCWQSKCHAANYPPGGFSLPRAVPPVVGPHLKFKYPTALDLYNYVSVNMPYHVPGTLTEAEYWQLTAYLLELNGMKLEDLVIDPSNAEELRLN